MINGLTISKLFFQDVAHAIDAAKRAILSTEENTESRKDKVLQLIKLQICQADLRERQETNTLYQSEDFETRGHRFATFLPLDLISTIVSQSMYLRLI